MGGWGTFDVLVTFLEVMTVAYGSASEAVHCASVLSAVNNGGGDWSQREKGHLNLAWEAWKAEQPWDIEDDIGTHAHTGSSSG